MYDEDLAFIQHEGFGDFAHRASPGLLAMLRAARIHSGTVLDLGCGAGVWLRELQRAGYTPRGIDASAALARIARRTARRAHVEVDSIHGRELPPCEAATATSEVLAYCPGGARRAPDLSRLFSRVWSALPRGGLFVFDLLVAGPPLAYKTWTTGRDWAVLALVRDDLPRRRLIREITTFRRVGGAFRRREERHLLQVPTRGEIEAALRSVGFTVRVLRRYGRLELRPRQRVFRARKI